MHHKGSDDLPFSADDNLRTSRGRRSPGSKPNPVVTVLIALIMIVFMPFVIMGM